MKLSEAILEGCKISGSVKNSYFNERTKCACTLGAAVLGIVGWEGVKEAAPAVPKFINKNLANLTSMKMVSTLPLPSPKNGEHLWNQIIHANDVVGMTREQIAGALAEAGF